MIVYFDSSALVPLVVDEPGTELCRSLWAGADQLVSCRIAHVEVAAALAQAQRLGRLSATEHRRTLAGLQKLWSGFDIVELDAQLSTTAAEFAERFALRGYDAVHAAAAALVAEAGTVAAAGDRALLDAWTGLGLTTVNTQG